MYIECNYRRLTVSIESYTPRANYSFNEWKWWKNVTSNGVLVRSIDRRRFTSEDFFTFESLHHRKRNLCIIIFIWLSTPLLYYEIFFAYKKTIFITLFVYITGKHTILLHFVAKSQDSVTGCFERSSWLRNIRFGLSPWLYKVWSRSFYVRFNPAATTIQNTETIRSDCNHTTIGLRPHNDQNTTRQRSKNRPYKRKPPQFFGYIMKIGFDATFPISQRPKRAMAEKPDEDKTALPNLCRLKSVLHEVADVAQRQETGTIWPGVKRTLSPSSFHIRG